MALTPWRDVLFALVYLVIIAGGAAIWFGWWRGWVNSPVQYYASKAPAMPWGSLIFLILGLVVALHAIGVEVPQILFVAPMLVCAALFLSIALFDLPGWALPPWYREWKRNHGRHDK